MDDQDVAEYFDSESDIYSSTRAPGDIGSWDKVDKWLKQEVDDTSRVLDIGCGDGLFLEYSFAENSISEGIGVDISTDMLPSYSSGRSNWVIGTATELPFKPGSFDVIHMANLLHHIVGDSRKESKRKAQNVVADAVSLLRDGGTLIITEQFYEGPIKEETITSRIIFYSLKEFSNLTKYLDTEAREGLVTSFYTRDELRNMIQEEGGTIIDTKTVPSSATSILREILIRNSGRIDLLVKLSES